MSFGKRLKYLRVKSDLSQTDLAEILGLSANTICQYENDKRFPDQRGIISICLYFSVSSDYLLGLSDNMTLINNNGTYEISSNQKKAIDSLLDAFDEEVRKS